MEGLGRYNDLAMAFATVAILVGTGILAAWRGVLTRDRISVLSDVGITLLLPIFAFWHGATDLKPESLEQAPWMFILGLVTSVAGFALATGMARLLCWGWPRRPVLQMVGGLGNTGFLGIPLCAALFGAQGTILAILYDFGTTIVFFALAVPAFQQPSAGDFERRFLARRMVRQLANPLFGSLCLGLSLSVARIALPLPLHRPLENLSSMVVPLMMLILGAIVYHSTLRSTGLGWDMLVPVVLKMALIPAVVLLVVGHLPLSPVARSVVAVQAAMPCAMSGSLFAERYNADQRLAAGAILVSTLLAAATLPAIVMLTS